MKHGQSESSKYSFDSHGYLSQLKTVFIIFCIAFSCSVTAEPGRLFLTFDDGPINASLNVLDVLKDNDIKATFFVNGVHIKGEGWELEDLARTALTRMIQEGHVVANHGYDHMAHNHTPGQINYSVASYKDVVTDSLDFSPINSSIINEALGPLKRSPNNAIETLGRLPFSNSWKTSQFTLLCHCCTTDDVPSWHPENKCGKPELPISQSARIAGKVAEKLYNDVGMAFIGWDYEWTPTNWDAVTVSETLASVEVVQQDVINILNGKTCGLKEADPDADCNLALHKNKAIILTHDFFYENSHRGRGKDINIPRLDQFIKNMKEKGYIFDTLDNYLK